MITSVPYHLRIGVTGHRSLAHLPRLAAEVDRVIDTIAGMLPASPLTPVHLVVVSPLAEGADRLVAERVLARPHATMEAVLPLSIEDYEEDFTAAASRDMFRDLLQRAATRTELPVTETREDAYEQAGRYVVGRCDVLLALWDGLPARGISGTANVVQWGQDQDIPVFWLNTAPPFTLTVLQGEGINGAGYAALDRFNRIAPPPQALDAECQRVRAALLAQAEQAGLAPESLTAVLDWSVPLFVHADLAANRAQRQYFWLTDATFWLSAGAVIAAAGPQLARPGTLLAHLAPATDLRIAPLLECALLLLGVTVITIGRSRGYHLRWIGYRFLAERLRSAQFLALVSGSEPTVQNGEPTILHQADEDWMQRAYDALWHTRPRALPDLPVAPLRRFLATAWLHDQRAYQERKGHRHEEAHQRLSSLGLLIFGLTLVFALVEAFRLTENTVVGINGATLVLYLSIILPTLAGALTGIATLREHPRNAHRSLRMAHYLARIEQRMARAPDVLTVRDLVVQAEMMALEERGDWLVTMQLREVGISG